MYMNVCVSKVLFELKKKKLNEKRTQYNYVSFTDFYIPHKPLITDLTSPQDIINVLKLKYYKIMCIWFILDRFQLYILLCTVLIEYDLSKTKNKPK